MREMNMNKVYIDGLEFRSVPELQNLSFRGGKIPDYVRSIHTPLSASAEISLECEADPMLFERLTGADLSRYCDLSGLTLEFRAPYQEQVRRHKKRRINKKWAKRYGYKTKFKNVRITDAQLKSNGDDFELVGGGMHVLLH